MTSASTGGQRAGRDDVDPATGAIRERHFAAQYAAADRAGAQDPWDLGPRWYERRKRAVTLACLARERYRRAFEPGCAVGLLTTLLADRCDALHATDIAPAAVRATRERMAAAGAAHVLVEQMAVPDAWPAGRFDLVVLSEIGYYLRPEALTRLRDRASAALDDGGELLAVHWRGSSTNHVLTGDEVHDQLRSSPTLVRDLHHDEGHFVLERFVRLPR